MNAFKEGFEKADIQCVIMGIFSEGKTMTVL